METKVTADNFEEFIPENITAVSDKSGGTSVRASGAPPVPIEVDINDLPMVPNEKTVFASLEYSDNTHPN